MRGLNRYGLTGEIRVDKGGVTSLTWEGETRWGYREGVTRVNKGSGYKKRGERVTKTRGQITMSGSLECS